MWVPRELDIELFALSTPGPPNTRIMDPKVVNISGLGGSGPRIPGSGVACPESGPFWGVPGTSQMTYFRYLAETSVHDRNKPDKPVNYV